MTIYEQALAHYGVEMQTMVCIEEMSELQKELCKHARGAKNVDAIAEEIAEEIADVQIMLTQMMILHNCELKVSEEKRRKLIRLAVRIKQE